MAVTYRTIGGRVGEMRKQYYCTTTIFFDTAKTLFTQLFTKLIKKEIIVIPTGSNYNINKISTLQVNPY